MSQTEGLEDSWKRKSLKTKRKRSVGLGGEDRMVILGRLGVLRRRIRVQMFRMIEGSRRFCRCRGGRECGRVFKKRVVGVRELHSQERSPNGLARHV